ncbi:MAG: hypothetical protein ACYDDZ_12365 [Acidimicrobiales bacterium]
MTDDLHPFRIEIPQSQLGELSEADHRRFELMGRWNRAMSGHARLQSKRPQTLAHALTNVSPYWSTATTGSPAGLYYEGSQAWFASKERSAVPTGVAVFPMDVTIRGLAERDHNVVRFSELDRGGHFAAMEAPILLVDDARAFFRPLLQVR